MVTGSLANKFYRNNAQVMLTVPMLISGLAAFFVVPMLGALSDRRGRKVVLLPILGLATPWVLMWALDLSHDGHRFKIFLAAQATFGALGDLPGVMGLCFSYVADCVAAERRNTICGLLMAFGCGAGFVVGPSVVSTLFDEGQRTTLTLSTIVAVMMLQVLYASCIPESLQKRATTPTRANPAQSFHMLTGEAGLQRSLLRRLFAIMFLCYLVKVGLAATLGVFAMQVFSFDAQASGTLTVVYGASQSLSQLSLPLLLRCVSRQNAIRWGLFMGFVAAMLPAIPHMPAFGLFISEVALGVPYIVYTLVTTMAASVVPASQAGEASMTITAALTLSSAVGPIAFGSLSSATVTSAYPGSAFCLFIVAMLASIGLAWGLPADETLQALSHDAHATPETKVEEA